MPSRPDPFALLLSILLSGFLAALLMLLLLTKVYLGPAHAQDLDEGQDSAGQAISKARECGFPQGVLDRLLAAGLEGRLSAQDNLAILDIFLKACDQGLPLEPLADKTGEGLAKRVDGPRLLAALAAVHGDLAFAREHLDIAAKAHGLAKDQAVAPAMILSAASALAAGFDRTDLDELLDRPGEAPLDMRVTAIEVAALFQEAGFAPEQVLDLVRQGLDASSLTPEWKTASVLAARARQRGLSDQDILRAAGQVLAEAGTVKDFLEKLGFTARDLQHGATQR